MTAPELSELVVDLARELSEVRRELDAYRLLAGELASYRVLAVQAVHYCHALASEVDRVEARYHRFLREQRGIDREAIARADVEDAAPSEAVAA